MHTAHTTEHDYQSTSLGPLASTEDGNHAATLAAYPDDGLSAFLRARPRLFGIAYRMMGSAAEAEDIVQDVWLRWQTTDRSRVHSPLAFLVAATTRLGINMLQSARARRETCAGSSLPEVVDNALDPSSRAEQREALNIAVVRLLEKLLPTELAAYVLREAFNYAYREIANILRVEEANARQLVTRARKHLSGGRRAPVSPARQRRLIDAFIAAGRKGDLARLESLFASDVVSRPDTSQRILVSGQWLRRSGPPQIETAATAAEGNGDEATHHATYPIAKR
jgi:RNA polymerase sigma-70 factor (ECF subfamily)